MKYSRTPKSTSMDKIIKAISRNEELEQNDGKWVCKNRAHKNKKKYDRKQLKREMSRGDVSLFRNLHHVGVKSE